MKYYEYFSMFLEIEEEMANIIHEYEINKKINKLYMPKFILFLLKICPLIESKMVDITINSETVKKSELYKWKYSNKLWEDTNKTKIKNFPKFSYVLEKIYSISQKEVSVYYSKYFKLEETIDKIVPFDGLKNFVDYKTYIPKPKDRFPTGISTPEFWTAYNKIKHSFNEAKDIVNSKLVLEALAGLFVVLAYCDIEKEILEKNGFIVKKEQKEFLRTKLFEAEV